MVCSGLELLSRPFSKDFIIVALLFLELLQRSGRTFQLCIPTLNPSSHLGRTIRNMVALFLLVRVGFVAQEPADDQSGSRTLQSHVLVSVETTSLTTFDEVTHVVVDIVPALLRVDGERAPLKPRASVTCTDANLPPELASYLLLPKGSHIIHGEVWMNVASLLWR